MTKVFTIKQCLDGEISIDEHVTVRGWVKTRRDSKMGLSFISLHDGSCFAPIQIVATDGLSNYNEEVSKLNAGCALIASGKLVASQGKGQAFEIQADSIQVVGWVENPDTYPIQAKRHTLEFLREVAHLRPRTNTISAVTRIRHCLSQAIHRFFHEQGFFWIHTPIITSSDCEGAGEMFRVSTLDLLNVPKNEYGQIDFSKDFLVKKLFLPFQGS